MTPAVELAKRQKISFRLHEYIHDPKSASYGLEAAEKLKLPPERVFKTLVVELADKSLAVAVLPVTAMLNMKLCAKALAAEKADMADGSAVERSSGYVLGGVSPLGQKKALKTVIDQSARGFDSIFVSGGKRGLEIELAADDLVLCTRGTFASIC